MSNQKHLNVRGTERMCRDHIENVHLENMRDLDNTYQLNRLKENNQYELNRLKENNRDACQRKELEIKFENQKESNRRAMIETETKAAIDTMRAKGDVEAQIKRAR